VRESYEQMPGEPTTALEIRGPISRADLPGLCNRMCAALSAGGARLVRCDVGSVEPNTVTVEALARLQLAAGRLGRRVLLCQASKELVELVAFMGLTDVLACDEFPATRPSESPTTYTKEERMSRMIFPNLPVKDLDRSKAFFAGLGFEFDPRFTDENAAAMIVNDQAVVMLLREEFFKGFTSKELVDSTKQVEAIIALSEESREGVDAFCDKALELGGSFAKEPLEMGFMYGRSFADPDGHHWEVFWMDMDAVEQAGTAATAASA
jgi:predicted lactoylglutathione lyase